MDRAVQKVHLIFKTHLDVGFTELAREVIDRYFSHYIPAAIERAETLRREGEKERLVWTTGSWLIYEYLEQASPAERRRMEEAILAGDIVWHGLPFSTHSELMDPSLFAFGLRLSQALDRRFGKETIAAKMTDVPGHTRGIVPLLAHAGIALLHIGVNPASTPPDVPNVFVWRAPGGADVIVVYQSGSYGDLTTVEGVPDALAFAHSNDNLGPPTIPQIKYSFDRLRMRFPEAEIAASTLTAFARRLLPAKDSLPVITGEIGDTWIHGAGTDPKKVSHFRELCRLRRRWEAEGALSAEDPRFWAMSRALLMIPEHTWGLDEKTHLADTTHYEASAFRAERTSEKFKRFEASWAEQRAYLDRAVLALDPSPLADEARRRLSALAPARPDLSGMDRVPCASARFETEHFEVGFDGQHGAITWLVHKATGRRWAAPEHALSLFRYEIFSQDDYDRFFSQYINNQQETAAWARHDFTKPGMGRAVPARRAFFGQLSGMHARRDGEDHRFLLSLVMPEECSVHHGCPREVILEASFPDDAPLILLTLQWFDKPACRLPEALWLSFAPAAPDANGWTLDKMGDAVSPGEIVRHGNQKLSAVGSGVSYRDGGGRLAIETLDAPLVALGEPSLLCFDDERPAMEKGVSVNLYNNVWGTNFPMWYEEDARFRFILRFEGGSHP